MMMHSEEIARKRFVIQAYSIGGGQEYKDIMDEFSSRYGYNSYEDAKDNGINVFEEPYTSEVINFLKERKPEKYIATINGLSGGKGFG